MIEKRKLVRVLTIITVILAMLFIVISVNAKPKHPTIPPPHARAIPVHVLWNSHAFGGRRLPPPVIRMTPTPAPELPPLIQPTRDPNEPYPIHTFPCGVNNQLTCEGR